MQAAELRLCKPAGLSACMLRLLSVPLDHAVWRVDFLAHRLHVEAGRRHGATGEFSTTSRPVPARAEFKLAQSNVRGMAARRGFGTGQGGVFESRLLDEHSYLSSTSLERLSMLGGLLTPLRFPDPM